MTGEFVKKNRLKLSVATVSILIALIIFQRVHGLPFITKAASTITVSTDQHKAVINQNITAHITMDTHDSPVNSVGLVIDFNPSVLSVSSINTTSSFCTFYIDRSYHNTTGTINLFCGSPSPGFKGQQILETIVFNSIGYGNSAIAIDPKSQVLANDGRGTNLLKRFEKVNISVILSQ